MFAVERNFSIPAVKVLLPCVDNGFKVAKLFDGVSTFWVSVPDVVNV